MIDKLHIQHDWAAVLAFVFGAAVVVPSVFSLIVSLAAVAATLL